MIDAEVDLAEVAFGDDGGEAEVEGGGAVGVDVHLLVDVAPLGLRVGGACVGEE